jgi:pimeloyl-ACP methyl ester carboxylesterase
MTSATTATVGPPHREHRVRAADGRRIAVAEWGDPAGLPLIDIHGTPGGRISYWRDPGVYARHGLRRLTFDRAGYGESTRNAGRRVVDVVPDVVAIADALGVDRFAVTGRSGGGPHALACAAQLPHRVIRCLAAVSIAPPDAEGLDHLAGMTEGNVAEFRVSLEGEAAIRGLVEPERITMLERIAAHEVDFLPPVYQVAASDRDEIALRYESLTDPIRFGLAASADGWVDDDLAFAMPWGFDVAAIRVPVCVAYGRADTLVPAAHGDWLARHVPGAVVEVSDIGHMADETSYARQLAWLAGSP